MPRRVRAIPLREQRWPMRQNAVKTAAPTHPGALLRDDVLPATGRTKAEIAGLLGISRQRLYDILQERKRYRQPSRFGSASLLAMARESGRGCRPPTTRGMRSESRTSVISRLLRPGPLRSLVLSA